MNAIGIAPQAGPDDLTVLVACDDAYGEWLMPLALSIHEHSPETFLHAHVINAGPAVHADLALLRATLGMAPPPGFAAEHPRRRVSWSLQDIPRGNFSEERWRALMSVVRFVIGEQMLGQGLGRVLILDVDSIVRRPLDRLLGGSVTVFPRPDNPPHMRYAAGAVYAEGPGGHAFLRRLVAEINALPLAWFVDQQALARVCQPDCIVTPEGRRFADLDVETIGQDFLDWEWGADSAIWTGKGPRKHEQNAFTDEVLRLQVRAWETFHPVVGPFWTGTKAPGSPAGAP